METWVPEVGDGKYTTCLNKPVLRDEAIPIGVREMDRYNDGSVILVNIYIYTQYRINKI